MSHSPRLLERLAACISLAEPILLVGETGTGKTSVVQHLATLMPNRPTLHVVNMSQQSDSSDLLANVVKMVEKVFEKKREQQLEVTRSSSSSIESLESLPNRHDSNQQSPTQNERQQSPRPSSSSSSKRIKMHDAGLEDEWTQFKYQLDQLGALLDSIDNKFLFSFVEGTLVQEVRNGDWVLLDEINLANPETLECLSGFSPRH